VDFRRRAALLAAEGELKVRGYPCLVVQGRERVADERAVFDIETQMQ
jgi:hypothetical protein